MLISFEINGTDQLQVRLLTERNNYLSPHPPQSTVNNHLNWTHDRYLLSKGRFGKLLPRSCRGMGRFPEGR